MALCATPEQQIDTLLSDRGLRRTKAARAVLAYLTAQADISFTHARLQLALRALGRIMVERGTLYRLVDRLAHAGLLICRVDAQGVRRYQAVPANLREVPHFECSTCGSDRALIAGLESKALALQEAAQAAVSTLLAMGCRNLSMDLAVRGVCADCANKAGQVCR